MLTTIAAALIAMGIAGASSAAEPLATYAWVQWEADGLAHARAIVTGTTCPTLIAGAHAYEMTLRSAPQGNFSDGVCDGPYPAGTRRGNVEKIRLPGLPSAPRRIVVFGDGGCRLKGAEVQACNDPQRWPFALLIREMAKLKPDLVVHVGDYYYRETPCPPSGVDCTGSPYGDRTESWVADYFKPATPLFAVAPIVQVRGNHEDCVRSPFGWARYLSGVSPVSCTSHEPPVTIRFNNLQIVQADSANGDDKNAADPLFISDEHFADAQADGRETWLATHRPPVAYLAAHKQTGDDAGTHLAAILSGHIHLFAAASFPAEEPLLIVGTGGDNLEGGAAADLLRSTLGADVDARFGFAVFDRAGNGWNISVHAVDGTISHRCRLESRTVRCS